jgi:hypothetical protein
MRASFNHHRSRTETLIRPSGTFSHWLCQREKGNLATSSLLPSQRDGRRWPAGRMRASFNQHRSRRETLIRPSGTFSHWLCQREKGNLATSSLLPSAGWEKVANRPDEGLFQPALIAERNPHPPFGHLLPLAVPTGEGKPRHEFPSPVRRMGEGGRQAG